jgi:hypothetical protein
MWANFDLLLEFFFFLITHYPLLTLQQYITNGKNILTLQQFIFKYKNIKIIHEIVLYLIIHK